MYCYLFKITVPLISLLFNYSVAFPSSTNNSLFILNFTIFRHRFCLEIYFMIFSFPYAVQRHTARLIIAKLTIQIQLCKWANWQRIIQKWRIKQRKHNWIDIAASLRWPWYFYPIALKPLLLYKSNIPPVSQAERKHSNLSGG